MPLWWYFTRTAFHWFRSGFLSGPLHLGRLHPNIRSFTRCFLGMTRDHKRIMCVVREACEINASKSTLTPFLQTTHQILSMDSRFVSMRLLSMSLFFFLDACVSSIYTKNTYDQFIPHVWTFYLRCFYIPVWFFLLLLDLSSPFLLVGSCDFLHSGRVSGVGKRSAWGLRNVWLGFSHSTHPAWWSPTQNKGIQ